MHHSALNRALHMIQKRLFVEKLRELGYEFLSQKDRVDLYKRPGDIRYASIRRRDLISETEVRSTLRQAGQSEQLINTWVAGTLARQKKPQ